MTLALSLERETIEKRGISPGRNKSIEHVSDARMATAAANRLLAQRTAAMIIISLGEHLGSFLMSPKATITVGSHAR
jgi:hypothetical protein